MSGPRVIRADYANWRPVAGRKVLQLILEVPIEQTADVMEKLGVPMPGESKWCAVALLENGNTASGNGVGLHGPMPKPSDNSEAPVTHHGGTPLHTSASIAAVGTSEIPAKERRPFASLPLSQQAAIRSTDKAFQAWIGVSSDAAAADYIREHCRVTSRAHIRDDDAAGLRWGQLERDFKAHLTDVQYAGAWR